jgi:histidine triad (HIT) family protein
MENKDCIFCKIAKGEIPSVKIWEDEKHLAILDINPNTEGMTLVLTKEHHDSDATDMPDKAYKELMIATKKVAKMLKKKLNVDRVAFVLEGLGVNHIHVKLYPMYPSNESEGYVTTKLGPQKSTEELNKIAEKIIN